MDYVFNLKTEESFKSNKNMREPSISKYWSHTLPCFGHFFHTRSKGNAHPRGKTEEGYKTGLDQPWNWIITQQPWVGSYPNFEL
jgi:hypothetical protein